MKLDDLTKGFAPSGLDDSVRGFLLGGAVIGGLVLLATYTGMFLREMRNSPSRNYLTFVEQRSEGAKPEQYLGHEEDGFIIRINDGHTTRTYDIKKDGEGKLYQEEEGR